MHLMFTAALFTIAKTWQQLKYPSIDEWIKIRCVCVYIHIYIYIYIYMYTHTMEQYSAIKMNEIMPFELHGWTCGRMDCEFGTSS